MSIERASQVNAAPKGTTMYRWRYNQGSNQPFLTVWEAVISLFFYGITGI